VQDALDALKLLSLVFESSGSRVARYEHNFQRVLGVPEQSAVLLGLLMLRGPQTAGELRINSERWYRFADISSVDGFPGRAAGPQRRKRRPAGGQAAARAGCTRAALGALCCAARWTRWPRPLPPPSAAGDVAGRHPRLEARVRTPGRRGRPLRSALQNVLEQLGMSQPGQANRTTVHKLARALETPSWIWHLPLKNRNSAKTSAPGFTRTCPRTFRTRCTTPCT
jgi:hypothetical protein